jgi:hypothetical protein
MSKKTQKRPLEAIVADLTAALKQKTTSIIAIGKLLNEANLRVKHGEWATWLQNNFALSRQTADNYRKVHKLSIKMPTIGDLRLRPGALYDLCTFEDEPEVSAAVLEEAKDRWVDSARVGEIYDAVLEKREAAEWEKMPPVVQPPYEQPEPEGQPDFGEPEDEVDPADRPPPTAEPVKAGSHLAMDALMTHVHGLRRIYTKPLASFAGVAVPTEDLRAVAAFLMAVADEVDKTRTQAPVSPVPGETEKAG